MHAADVELHVDLAGDDDGIVDRVGTGVGGGDAGAEADDAEYRTVRNRGLDLLLGGIVVAVIVHRQLLARPDHRRIGAWTRGDDVSHHLVDQHLGAALRVMASDDAANFQTHAILLAIRWWAARRGRRPGAASRIARRVPAVRSEEHTSE